jgi:hypothetical protein
MNQELALRTLGQVLAWDDDRAREEFRWLRMMARIKYDGYRDFLAGARFIESLVTWLQQFEVADRETAYQFARRRLVYIGSAEMQRLIELFYPRTIEPRLMSAMAARLAIPRYQVWADPRAIAEIVRARRGTLIMGLSDGARLDVLRHANAGILSNEQLTIASQLDVEKWDDLLEQLRSEVSDAGAKFEAVYLVDDFMASGTTLLRYDPVKQKWKGKLTKFRDSLQATYDDRSRDSPLAEDWQLCVHHYVASHAAASAIIVREAEWRTAPREGIPFPRAEFSFGTVLPEDLPVSAEPTATAPFYALTQKYYDPVLLNRHTRLGGISHLGLGYGACALPVVLEHNTPNNSVALLWAETSGGVRDGGAIGHPMRALFRRRQRHS